MGFNKVWEKIHRDHSWGAYPKEELVRWVFRAWGGLPTAVRPTARFLDLGSGQGAATWFLAREGFSVTALDGSFSALVKARDRLLREGLPYQGVACCMTGLPFVGQTFDAVVDVMSSTHNSIHDIQRIYTEVARILKPGGRLFLVVPTNQCSRRPFQGRGKATFFEKDELTDMLHQHFTNLQVLRSSHELAYDCLIDNWIVTGNSRFRMA